MVKYNKVNARLSDSQLDKLRSAEVILISKCLIETIYLMSNISNKTKNKIRKCT